MDSHDRKELPAVDGAREEYLKKYGSFLYCRDRDTLCVHMDGMWLTGCERNTCILDDPDYQALQKRIEKNRRSAEAPKREHTEPDARSEMRRSVRERKLAEIHRLEVASEEAYRQNKPALGDSLFTKSRFMRSELKKEEEEWKRKKKGSAG